MEMSSSSTVERLPSGSQATTSTGHTGAVSIEHFSLLKMIGKGSFGKVFLAKKMTGWDAGTLYALKSAPKARDTEKEKQKPKEEKTEKKAEGEEEEKEEKTEKKAEGEEEEKEEKKGKEPVVYWNPLDFKCMLDEKNMLKEIKSPFIVKLQYAFQSPTKLYMVLEFARGGDMFSLLGRNGRLLEDDAKFYIAEVVLALEYLHHHDIVHHDLKPDNILLDAEGHIKLTDFGFSVKVNNGKPLPTYLHGTPGYMAPEVLYRLPQSMGVDWWSLGIVLHEFVTCELPFIRIQHIKEKKYVPPKFLTNDAKWFLIKLLKKNPIQRLGYGLRGTRDIMNERFFNFKSKDWDDRFHRRIPPPYIPVLASDDDTGHFNKKLTKENPRESETPEPNPVYRRLFKRFSYTAPEESEE